MTSPRIFTTLLLAGLLAAPLAATPAPGQFLRADAVNVAALIPPAPADNSLTTAADITTLLEVQKRRTPEAIAVAEYFANHGSAFEFAAVIGRWFTAEKLPVSAAVFARVAEDRNAIVSAGKRRWDRPRPPLLDPRLHPCIHLPHSPSYPSGHSTSAFLWADILAEIFPNDRAALRERAELIAWSRIIGGVHYPSDITAGRMLGDRLAQELLKTPSFQAALREVKAEVARVEPKPAAAVSP